MLRYAARPTIASRDIVLLRSRIWRVPTVSQNVGLKLKTSATLGLNGRGTRPPVIHSPLKPR